MTATIARAAGEASLARAIFVDRAQMSREGAWSHDRALALRLLVMFCAFLSSVVCRLPWMIPVWLSGRLFSGSSPTCPGVFSRQART